MPIGLEVAKTRVFRRSDWNQHTDIAPGQAAILEYGVAVCDAKIDLLNTMRTSNTAERRSEPRIEIGTSVVMTPLAAVATRLKASVVNVSRRGIRVRVGAQMKELPRAGDVYRVQSRDDLMLCEVRNSCRTATGAHLGLHIVHWGAAGELNRLVQD
jgi:hypothetical protein